MARSESIGRGLTWSRSVAAAKSSVRNETDACCSMQQGKDGPLDGYLPVWKQAGRLERCRGRSCKGGTDQAFATGQLGSKALTVPPQLNAGPEHPQDVERDAQTKIWPLKLLIFSC